MDGRREMEYDPSAAYKRVGMDWWAEVELAAAKLPKVGMAVIMWNHL